MHLQQLDVHIAVRSVLSVVNISSARVDTISFMRSCCFMCLLPPVIPFLKTNSPIDEWSLQVSLNLC